MTFWFHFGCASLSAAVRLVNTLIAILFDCMQAAMSIRRAACSPSDQVNADSNRADPERRSDDSIRVSVLWSALLLMRWRVYGKARCCGIWPDIDAFCGAAARQMAQADPAAGLRWMQQQVCSRSLLQLLCFGSKL